MSKAAMKKKIFSLDFAIHELVLFLDSHPTNRKALMLLREYRKMRAEAVKEYEARYGELIIEPSDTPITECWKWLDGPWPWENNFMEG